MGKARATRAAAGAGTGFAFFLMISGVVALINGVTLAGAWYVALGLFLQQAASGACDQLVSTRCWAACASATSC